MFKHFVIIGIVFFNLLGANEVSIVDQDQIYQQIIENEPEAILLITEDKIYLHHEKIKISNQGIFVGNVQVPTLYSDATGCWMSRQSDYWICQNSECTNYQNVYRNSTGRCPFCQKKGTQG